VLRNPVWSLPPVTPSPSPTPYDKYSSQAPPTVFHAAPDMEALLPDTIDGRPVIKESRTGVEGLTDDDPALKAFGKQPADLGAASGSVKPTDDRTAIFVGVLRLVGVPGEQLMAFELEQASGAKVSRVSLGGHEVTYVDYGAWPIWMYATGELVYQVGMTDEATAAAFFATLP
jgi:hypothetical protein